MRTFVLPALLALACLACSKSDTPAASAGATPSNAAATSRSDVPQGSGTLSFKVDGVEVVSDVWSLSYMKDMPAPGRTLFNLTTNMHRDKRVVLVNFEEPAAGKALEFVEGKRINYGSYSPVFGDISDSYDITAGQLTFSTFDQAKGSASGSFEFVARNAAGKEVKISDGKFADGKLVEAKMPKF